VVEISVAGRQCGVILDTGIAPVLRLSVAGLRRLGLPTDAKTWIGREGWVYPFAGIGMTVSHDVLIQLDRVAIGDLVLERPWVQLAVGSTDHPAPDLPYDGLLGGGVWLGLSRAAIDEKRMRLEMEPHPGLGRAVDGTWVVPDPGRYLGLILGRPTEAIPSGAEGPVIRSAIAGTPAALKGVLKGDRLLSIDGDPCRDLSISAIYRCLWLRQGSTVKLKLWRAEGEEIEVVLP
jgi:hypothetical protein